MDRGLTNYELQTIAARKLFLSFDQENMIRAHLLEADRDFLYLRFLGCRYRICRTSGRVEKETPQGWGREIPGFEEVMSIYDMLCNPNGRPVLSGTWLSVQEMNRLRSGAKTLGTGLHDGMERLFSGKQEALHRACRSLGGTPAPLGDVSYFLPVFDGFPVYFQFWEADEDFPPQIRVLWDGNTTRHIHFETTFYITAHLLRTLQRRMAEDTKISPDGREAKP